jgi:hypothetical protein
MNDDITDRDAVGDLLARYCLHLDRDEHEEWLSLFLPEATYEVYGHTFAGHDGLRRMLAGAPGGLHLGGPPVIRIEGDRARTEQNLLFVDAATGSSRSAVYDDDLERTDQGWRFARRRCRFITATGLSDRPDG